MKKENLRKIMKTGFILTLIIGIPCVLLMVYFIFMDKIEGLFPRIQSFKKICKEVNGKPSSWNEIKKLEGYCMLLLDDGTIKFAFCTEEYVNKYLNTGTLTIRSNPEVEGTWACKFDNLNGNIKTKTGFIPL